MCRLWHEAADQTLIAECRFLGEADIHGRAAPTASVVHEPRETLERTAFAEREIWNAFGLVQLDIGGLH